MEPGHKRNYRENLGWLSDLCPITFHFPNSKDGYKLLFADGIFCEFAVFEPHCESALSILSFLEKFGVNKAVADAVRELCG